MLWHRRPFGLQQWQGNLYCQRCTGKLRHTHEKQFTVKCEKSPVAMQGGPQCHRYWSTPILVTYITHCLVGIQFIPWGLESTCQVVWPLTMTVTSETVRTKIPFPLLWPSVTCLPLSPPVLLLGEMILSINLQLPCWTAHSWVCFFFFFPCLIWFIALEHYFKACSLFLEDSVWTHLCCPSTLFVRTPHDKTICNTFCLWYILQSGNILSKEIMKYG